MENKLGTVPGVRLEFKIKIQYKNGSNETVFAIKPPNVNPLMPTFLGMEISQGKSMRHINMSEIRSLDIEVDEANGGLVV
jgi:hypothetical protein